MIRFVMAAVLAACATCTTWAQEIEGPDQVDVGRPAWYRVAGVGNGASAAFIPTPLLDTTPARIVAGNALFWVARPGEYTLTAIIVDWDAHTFTPLTKQITVGKQDDPPVPPPPTPTPNPYPTPAPNWKAAVAPILKTTPPAKYAQSRAATFARLAETVRTDNALSTSLDLYQRIAAESSDGETNPAARAAVAAVIDAAIGRQIAPLDREEAAAMLEAIAWALWEAGQ